MNLNKTNCISKWTNPRSYVFALVLALFLLTANVWGQQVTGSVSGQVKDSSGAAIAGANVTARNTETGLSRSTTSNDNGNFLIVPVPGPQPGINVYAFRAGFLQPIDIRDQEVRGTLLHVCTVREIQIHAEHQGMMRRFPGSAAGCAHTRRAPERTHHLVQRATHAFYITRAPRSLRPQQTESEQPDEARP